jgi:fucose permease
VCFYSFINLGLNDACYGALLPSLEAYYGLDYTLVSLIFLSPFVGYSAASFANDPLHHSVGQQGIALIGPLTRATAYLILVFHPPWPAVIVVLAVGGFGSGLCDSAWNAWIGDFASANELLGFLHGWYGAGATISPLIATSLVTTYGKPWWFFFYIPLASCLVEAGGGLLAFWGVNGKVFSRRMEEEHGGQRGANKRLRAALGQRVTWLVALFLFLYVGIEVALSGWVVTFFLRVRHAPPFSAGLTSTGFWAGLTLGRVTLGFLTPRVGERLAVTVYLLVSMGLVLIFWLVPNLYVSAVAIALVGYFIGPLFPAAIVAAAKLLKKESHIPAIGFAAAVGGAGSAVYVNIPLFLSTVVCLRRATAVEAHQLLFHMNPLVL